MFRGFDKYCCIQGAAFFGIQERTFEMDAEDGCGRIPSTPLYIHRPFDYHHVLPHHLNGVGVDGGQDRRDSGRAMYLSHPEDRFLGGLPGIIAAYAVCMDVNNFHAKIPLEPDKSGNYFSEIAGSIVSCLNSVITDRYRQRSHRPGIADTAVIKKKTDHPRDSTT